jgi:hypothetical protein
VGLGVARVVHYISYGTPGGEYLPEHRAAMVTGVVDKEAGVVHLCVLNPTGFFFNLNVQYDGSANPKGGTWHWPEFV